MKKILGYEITELAVKEIESLQKKSLDEITKEEIQASVEEHTDLICIEDNYIIIEDELDRICTHSEFDTLYLIKELDEYIGIDHSTGDYCYHPIWGLSDFVDYYLLYMRVEDEYDREEYIAKELDNVGWYDTECKLYKRIQEELRQIDKENEDEDEDDVICLYSNELYMDLETALRKDEDYNDAKYEEMGYFCGRFVCKINYKLYYITDCSYTFNTERYWHLKEVGEKAYKHFGYEYQGSK